MHSSLGALARRTLSNLIWRPTSQSTAAWSTLRNHAVRTQARHSVKVSAAKSRAVFQCQECGAEQAQWYGRCPSCKRYNTVEEVTIVPEPVGGGAGLQAVRKALQGAQQGAAGGGGNGRTMQLPASFIAQHAAHEQQDGALSSYGEVDYADDPANSIFPDDGLLEADAARDGDAGPLFQDSSMDVSRKEARTTSISSSGGAGVGRTGGWLQVGDETPAPLTTFKRARPQLRMQLPGPTGAEVSRVLGGGLVPGALVLVGGDPGVGKSTLLLQVAALVAQACSAPAEGGHKRQREQPGQEGSREADAEVAPAADTSGAPCKGVEEQEGVDDDLPLAQRLRQRGTSNGTAGAAARAAAAPPEPAAAASPVVPLVPPQARGLRVLYVTAEESSDQVRLRAQRMGLAAPAVDLVSENRLERMLGWISTGQYAVAVVDSIQTVMLHSVEGRPGNVLQVKECAQALLEIAKKTHTAVLLVGHVTKDGNIAGPRTLEHLVDVVLYLEGEAQQDHRLLRAVKNRHGRIGELGIFAMRSAGLHAVTDYQRFFSGRGGGGGAEGEEGSGEAVGAAQMLVVNGVRPLVVEVQALCTDRYEAARAGAAAGRRGGGGEEGPEGEGGEGEGRGAGAPPPLLLGPPLRNTTNLFSKERLSMLLEVLAKHVDMQARLSNIFINIVSGYKLAAHETPCDLAICAAVASSYLDLPIPTDMALVGEVGLAGELRSVSKLEPRLYEAAKLGFSCAIIPSANTCDLTPQDLGGMRLLRCATLRRALEELFGPRPNEGWKVLRKAARSRSGGSSGTGNTYSSGSNGACGSGVDISSNGSGSGGNRTSRRMSQSRHTAQADPAPLDPAVIGA